MFNLFKSRKAVDQVLIKQVIGGQSVLFRMFREIFEEDPADIRRMELTYFASAVFTYAFLRFSSLSEEDKKATADRVANAVFTKSIPYVEEETTMDDVIHQYQQRYSEYNSLIKEFFEEIENTELFYSMLTTNLYEHVTGKSAQNKIVSISAADSLIAQYIVDHIEFIKEKKL